VKAVGVRDLKNHLSEYLRLVRRGERILVTDRGEVVAELRHPGAPPPKLRANRTDLYPALEPIAPDGTARVLIDEDRGER
jgi:antitoxin (DNA-binding transcriptional repressor) of toxin-antitoxin stability system